MKWREPPARGASWPAGSAGSGLGLGGWEAGTRGPGAGGAPQTQKPESEKGLQGYGRSLTPEEGQWA